MVFIKGDPRINREGRPKGSVSILTEIKKILKENPNKLKELVQYYLTNPKMRELLWKMIDGLPKQTHGIELDDFIGELKLTLIKNEKRGNENNGSNGEELEGVSEERKENNN